MTDRWGAQPRGFNRPAAEAIYKAMTAMDEDAAQVFARMIVGASVDHTLLRHGTELAKAADAAAVTSAIAMRKNLRRELRKAALEGCDASSEARALVTLVKFLDLTVEELRKDDEDRDYSRDRGGRFATINELAGGRMARQHVRVGYDARMRPLKSKHAQQLLGVQNPSELKGEDLARFQQAYGQINSVAAQFAGMPALAHLSVTLADGSQKTRLAPIGDDGRVPLQDYLAPGESVNGASFSVAPPTTAAGLAYDAFDRVGMGRMGTAAYRSVDRGFASREGLVDFRNTVESSRPEDEFAPSNRAFRNLEAGSKLLRDSLGSSAPRGAQLALSVGEHVGRLGPEAQRVIGPVADKAAYRYRGTERTVSPGLGAALNSVRDDQGLQVRTAGGIVNPRATARKRREFLLHGGSSGGDTETYIPSRVIQHMRNQLPRIDLNTLQLKSGVVPPSRGFIIDRGGKVQSESVGFGDDHYLPFNLKRLNRLKGGEYVRTRTFGGPTTEDIYTGLMSGARGLTVVSHSGVFTVDFADDLRGGRRFNDKAARMVARYGYLLDAVQSGQVTTSGIHPTRLAELQEKATRAVGSPERNPEGFRKEMNRLEEAERVKPELSQALRATAAQRYLEQSSPFTARGRTTSRQQLIGDAVRQQAEYRHDQAMRHYRGVGTPPSVEVMQRQVMDELTGGSPLEQAEKVADLLGDKAGLDRVMAQAEKENADRTRTLRLNGAGYQSALDALQEQFPQYIDRVEFHEWSDPAVSRGARDTGYVRPRHNRAAEALSGYFDDKVGRAFKGKAFADSTRNQNRNRQLRPLNTPRRADTGDAEDAARAGGSGTSGGSGGSGTSGGSGSSGGPAGGTSNAATEKLRSQAEDDIDLATFDALSAGSFAGAVKPHEQWANGTELLNGKNVSEVLSANGGRAALTAAAPDWLAIHQMPREQFAEALSGAGREEAKAKLRSAFEQARNLNLVDVAPQVTQDFLTRGKPAATKALPKDRVDLLRLDESADVDFGDHPAYDLRTKPTRSEIIDQYNDHPLIQEAIENGLLPARIDDDFAQQAGQGRAELKQQRDELARDARLSGDPVDQARYDEIGRHAEGVARGMQLGRRLGDAQLREDRELARRAVEMGPPDSVTVMDEDTLRSLGPEAGVPGSGAAMKRLLGISDD